MLPPGGVRGRGDLTDVARVTDVSVERTAALTSIKPTRTHRNTVWIPTEAANRPAPRAKTAQPMVSKMVRKMANAWPRSSGGTTEATMGRLTGGLSPWQAPKSDAQLGGFIDEPGKLIGLRQIRVGLRSHHIGAVR